MFVLKNRHATELSGANCHEKYSSSDVSTILLTVEKIFTVLK